MTGKIRVHIDPKGYDEKPSGKEIGGIKSRLQKGTRPSLVTLEELVQKIRTGHSISPGIMEGVSAKNWKEQQLFMVDIDNEEDGPILCIKDARAICRDNGLPLAFCYQTFSYTKEHPKFRLGFVMDKPITDADMRKHIMETLVNSYDCPYHGRLKQSYVNCSDGYCTKDFLQFSLSATVGWIYNCYGIWIKPNNQSFGS